MTSTSKTDLALRVGPPSTRIRRLRLRHELKAVASTLKELPLHPTGVTVVAYEDRDISPMCPALLWRRLVWELRIAGMIGLRDWPRSLAWETRESTVPRLFVTITY